MIQRIQTVYLLASSTLLLVSLFFPVVSYHLGEGNVIHYDLLKLSGSDSVLSLPVFFSLLMSIILGAVAVFQFKNRIRQMQLIRAAMLFSVLTFLAFGATHYYAISSLRENNELEIAYSLTVIVPVLATVLQWMALKGVKKDDEKIKSVDRLR